MKALSDTQGGLTGRGITSLRNAVLAATLGVVACLPVSAIANDANGELMRLRNQARSLEIGEGVARNPQEAVNLYCRAARAGDAESMYRLGWMFAFGKGIQRDDAAAAYYFTRAAGLGHAQSENMLKLTGRTLAATDPCLKDEFTGGMPDLDRLNPEQRRLVELIRHLAPQYGVAPRLALTLALAESNLNAQAVSARQAQGVMQLIPETARRFNVRRPFDPEQNIRGGLAYLRWLLAYFEGDVKLVAAAYNAGEGVVNRYLGVPPYPETRGYVRSILAGYRQPTHPFDPSVTEPSPELQRILLRQARTKA